jgi:hypothetical protein
MYARSELRADCPRVIGQKSCVRDAQPRGERNGRRCFLLFNGPVDRAAWRSDDPVTGTPGGCLQSAALRPPCWHSACHAAHRITKTHTLWTVSAGLSHLEVL